MAVSYTHLDIAERIRKRHKACEFFGDVRKLRFVEFEAFLDRSRDACFLGKGQVLSLIHIFEEEWTPADKIHELSDVQAIGAAAQNMALQATSMGIGSLWIGNRCV